MHATNWLYMHTCMYRKTCSCKVVIITGASHKLTLGVLDEDNVHTVWEVGLGGGGLGCRNEEGGGGSVSAGGNGKDWTTEQLDEGGIESMKCCYM